MFFNINSTTDNWVMEICSIKMEHVLIRWDPSVNDGLSLYNIMQVPYHKTTINSKFMITIGFLSLVYKTVANMKFI
jgi:hypothetical protein